MYDLAVIGGGPAGLAAAYSAYEKGLRNIVILERDKELGGILNQCIHNGFGLHRFKEELSGPEYAHRYIEMVQDTSVEVKLDTMVIEITPDKKIFIDSPSGYECIEAKSIVLSMGCRERTRGAISIPGTRPSGVFTAGAAQRYLNMEGLMAGKRVVILGSGDIGLIMARRMTLEGAKVKAVAELMPYSGGLKRNIVQCLDDFGIPLKLSHTVTRIHGKERVTGVTLSQVGADRKPIPGTEEFYECDTLLLSCGLLPENELSKTAGVALDPVTGGAVVSDSLETSVPGIFSCGNVLHVHDLVDNVSKEAAMAGRKAAEYVQNHADSAGERIALRGVNGVRYTVPQSIDLSRMDDQVTVRMRVSDVFRDKALVVCYDGTEVKRMKKRVMAPGEMEEVVIRKDTLTTGVKEITIGVEG